MTKSADIYCKEPVSETYCNYAANKIAEMICGKKSLKSMTDFYLQHQAGRRKKKKSKFS
jgi:hypothetical protein